jgi:hypothetical protein
MVDMTTAKTRVSTTPRRLDHINVALLPINGLQIRPANGMPLVMNERQCGAVDVDARAGVGDTASLRVHRRLARPPADRQQ